MIVTEEEAKTKRCQEGYPASNGVTATPSAPVMHSIPLTGGFVSGLAGASYGVSAEQGPTAPYYCIGGQCMAWQWWHKRTDDGIQLGYCGKATP